MKLHHRIQLGFWGAMARIGHLLQRREARVLEKQVCQQARTIHHLVAANIELEGRLRECESQVKTALAARWLAENFTAEDAESAEEKAARKTRSLLCLSNLCGLGSSRPGTAGRCNHD